MAVINRNLQLRDINLNLVFPRASLDNIQRSKNDGRDALIVTLDDTGHISSAYLPDAAESVVMLLAATNTAPTGAVAGDRYYNISQNKVYTYVSSSWTSAVTPDINKLYITKNNGNIYRYDGTSQMVDISTHFTVLQSVANDPTDASVTGVPSEYAVSVALQKKQDKVSGTAPVSVDNTGTVSLQYGAGLKVNSNNLVADQDYIVYTVDSLMLRDAGPADQSTAYVNGGTVYTILGNCSITTSVSSTGASDTKVPTEAAVRSAVNAAIATGGSTVVPGKAINVTGGSINVTPSTIPQVTGSTVVNTGDTTVTTVAYDDLSALTPKALHDAMSLGQVIDITHAAKRTDGFQQVSTDGGSTWATITQETLYNALRGNFSIRSSASVAANTETLFGFVGGADTSAIFVSGHRYLMLCDVRNASSIALLDTPVTARNLYAGGNPFDGVPNITNVFPAAANQTTYTRVAVVFNGGGGYGYFAIKSGTAGVRRLDIKNWRQYDVTGLSNDAISYLANCKEPDLLFRNSQIKNIEGRYVIKHDMVSPYIPIFPATANTDLVIAPGHAYSLTFTDSNQHRIIAPAFPTDAWAHDSFLQLTVKDAANVVFDGINLMSPLRSNSGNNIIIKFRAGQVNAYVEDTDVGYIVTLNSGSQNGSLAYGLGNNVGNYIVFSDTTNIT